MANGLSGGLAFGVIGWALFWSHSLYLSSSAHGIRARLSGRFLGAARGLPPQKTFRTCMYGIENGINGFAGLLTMNWKFFMTDG